MSNEGYHEPIGELSDEVRDMHRAIVSLMEELEAVDWYNQRAAACKDPVLKKILEHNRDEEKEHAAMLMEWICWQQDAGQPPAPGSTCLRFPLILRISAA